MGRCCGNPWDFRDLTQFYSIEFRTFIPSDAYLPDGPRDTTTPMAVPMAMDMGKHPTDVPDFQARRFRQPPPPNALPPQMDQRARYPDRSMPPDRRPTESAWRGPTFPNPRRPLHRISARISARPKRSPSPPISISSDSSASGPPRSRQKSRSDSRSTRSRPSSLEREPRRDLGSQSSVGRRSSPPRKRSPDVTRRQAILSPTHSTLGRPHTLPSHPQTISPSASSVTSARLPSTSSILPESSALRPPGKAEIIRPRDERKRSRRSPSASSQISQSSIRSSVHSSPGMAATQISPDSLANRAKPAKLSSPEIPNTNVITELVPRPSDPPSEEPDFELPGMRFQKDGALKPGLSPPSPISGLDIEDNLANLG